ncbi:unnamed protein product [Thelazia callipaeda]|uniref:Metallophos domain-containing protein n=1 Tax=Thelazia callipaeda TaxID=103827 RepID=A0A0N5CUV2_THECL|nr:unnamed protein product [Thelazia callipaeda]
MDGKRRGFLLVLVGILFVFIYNEYLIYYVTIYTWCSWPIISSRNGKREEETKVMMVTDIHLLGPRRGHWFDKLRREWQMYRSFQSAISLMHPHAVFFLGDLFDESTISNLQGLENYVKRFNELFYVPRDIQVHCIFGNHDIGFHDEVCFNRINPARLQFLSQHFARSFADHIVLNGNHFVLLNSMTLERDGCYLCTTTEFEIEKLSRKLNCTKNGASKCNVNSRPILLLHFPLFRHSDAQCPDDYDAAVEPAKSQIFTAGIDCLSNASSHYVLNKLDPRAVFNGHTHHSCRTWWPAPYNMYEWTLSSFSWRNIVQPAFLLVTITASDIQVNKCFLPSEKIVVGSYAVCIVSLVIILSWSFMLRFAPYWKSTSSEILTTKFD